MAPEVFWSGSLDASADVYSLGLLLYAGVMGGRLPFYPDDRAPQPEDMAAALRRRMNGEALPPGAQGRARSCADHRARHAVQAGRPLRHPGGAVRRARAV